MAVKWYIRIKNRLALCAETGAAYSETRKQVCICFRRDWCMEHYFALLSFIHLIS